MRQSPIFHKRLYFLIVVAICGAISFAFQNCSDVKFGQTPDLSNATSCDPMTQDCSRLPPPPPKCESGYTSINGMCVRVQTLFSGCLSFKELDTNIIPPLQSTGVCYYKKLIDASPIRSSGSMGEARAADVISRNHSGSGNIAPFTLGDSLLNLTFEAQRSVSLASLKVVNSSEIALYKMKVDNYILVEVRDANSPLRVLARGTADAVPVDGPITVGHVPVTDFVSYAEGGTAEVDVINISTNITVGAQTSIRVRMLDCGESAVTSNMFIIIH